MVLRARVVIELTDEQFLQAKACFEKDTNDVDHDDVEYASKKGQKKLDGLASKIRDALKDLWQDTKLMVSLLCATNLNCPALG